MDYPSIFPQIKYYMQYKRYLPAQIPNGYYQAPYSATPNYQPPKFDLPNYNTANTGYSGKAGANIPKAPRILPKSIGPGSSY